MNHVLDSVRAKQRFVEPFQVDYDGDLDDVPTAMLAMWQQSAPLTLWQTRRIGAELNRRARVLAADVRAGLRCPLCGSLSGIDNGDANHFATAHNGAAEIAR